MQVQIDPRSFQADLLISVLVGLFMTAVGRLIEIASLLLHFSNFWAGWADDAFAGVVAFIVVFHALRNNSARRRLIKQRLNDIVDTNHNIRNALQVINTSHWAPDEASRLKMVAESVARIEKTLREFSVVDGASRTKLITEKVAE